ncbi:MAG: conjugal transfer protein TraD [Cyanobacteria bacterium P01_B01_bin.77]
MNRAEERLRKRVKKIGQQIEKSRQEMRIAQQQLKKQERKKRTRELIQLGGLADIAGFRGMDTGAVLGAFLQGIELLKDEATYKNLKHLGDKTLARRAGRRRDRSKKANTAEEG